MSEEETQTWILKKKRRDDSLWEEAQKKTFCGWVNMHLSKNNNRVQDLQTDFCDGVKLIALLEILNGKKIEGRYYRNPKSKPYKIDNVNFALSFITDTLKIKLISCSAEDIVDGNVKIILGMLWRLIQRFQLTEGNSRAALLRWCKEVTADKDISIDNFQSSFENGLAFCALVDGYDSTLIEYSSLNATNKMQNLNLAFGLIEERMEIPQLLDAADISNGLVDERSVMTYLSMIHAAFTNRPEGKPVETKRESNDAIDSDAPLVSPKAEKATIVTGSSSEDTKELESQVKKLTAENNQLRARISELEKEIDSLKSSSSSSEQSLKDALSKAEKERDAAVEAKNQLEKKLSDLEASQSKESPKEVPVKEEPAEEPKVEEPVKEEPEPEKEEPKAEEPATEEPKVEEPAEEETKEVEPAEEPKVEETAKEEPAEESKEAEPATEEPKAASEGKTVDELQNEVKETRDKLREQIKVSETLQKSLEDTREEISLIQKRQKRAQDKAVKKAKARYEKRIQRRDKIIETLKKEREADMAQKDAEIESIKNQLRIAQSAAGKTTETGGDQSQEAMENDITFLRQEKADLAQIVNAFEEEERALAAKKTLKTTNFDDDKDDEGDVSEME
mmetsp:Transcript_7368/g.15343  ORF Transcript_7368/g.15343 Transcript_7368/m.15343 type:complete len:621 (-) Transcript_7368:55-1917(-)